MKSVYTIFSLICVTSLWLSLSSYQSGAANKGRSATGAPFGNGTCGSCHGGGTYGTVTVTVQIFEVGTTTLVNNYVGGKAYDAKLSISSTTTAPFRAFQMVAVNAANAQAGTWSGFPTGVRSMLLTARTYVEQSTKLAATSFKMTWVAPAAGTGAVKFYACGNALDGTGDEGGDNVGTTVMTLAEQAAPTCTSATVTTSSVNAACANSATGSATVTPTGGTMPYTYLWSNGTTTQTATNLLSGTYTCTITEGGGCKTTSPAITVGANTLTASVVASGATTFCSGGSVNLTASGGTSYAWSTGATTATLSNVAASGTYTCTVSNGNCSATASQIVTVTPAPAAAITASGPTTFCPGGSVSLTASGGTTYKWSTGATTAALSNITTAGTYTVTVTSGTCTATTSQVVTVSNLATANITASGATSFCQGGSVNLTATGGGTYKWSTGATTAALSNITSAGTYSVTVTNGTCMATASQIVAVNVPPTATITPSGATTFCQGSNVNLVASGGTTYKWSDGSTAASLSNIATSGTYTVTVANGNCTASKSQIVTVNPLPTANINSSAPTTFCQGGKVDLIATGGTAYLWSTGATTATLANMSSSGAYTVTVTNANGCKSTANQNITVIPMPVPSIAASGATTFCQGKSVVLTASGGTTYTWSNGVTTAINTVSTAGNYTVTAANGTCTATASKTISTIPAPSVRLTSTASNGLNGTATATVTGGTPPYIYDWNNNATNYTLIGLSAGTYFVTVTDANGCTTEGSVDITATTATKDLNAPFQMAIHPVPNQGKFNLTLELPKTQTVQVDVFNLIGQKVGSSQIVGKSISETIDMGYLTEGQYLVKINTESGIATRWMVVSK